MPVYYDKQKSRWRFEFNRVKRVNVYLDAATLERAANLGSGNVSEGIRIALERATGR